MARRISRTPFVRGKPRSNVWIGLGLARVTVAAATPTLLATLNAGALGLRPFTVVRTHLLFQVISDQVAASEIIQGALGMQVVTETAAAAGVASLPTPLTETDADFFVYQPWFNALTILSAVGFEESTGQGASWTVDSKSMRKVGTDDDVAVTIENRALGYDVSLEGRMLVKLH